MARKATDLLDVFRFGGGGDDDEEARSSRPARKSAARRKPRDRKPARRRPAAKARSETDGIHLSRRQLLLAASAVLLLMVLGFVLGLLAGQPDDESEAPKALQRQASSGVMIQGRMDAMDARNLRPIPPAEVRLDLIERYRVPVENVVVRRDDHDLVIEIGPFPTERAARQYLVRSGLDVATIRFSAPFLYPRYPAYRR